jgi:hypothetical protein
MGAPLTPYEQLQYADLLQAQVQQQQHQVTQQQQQQLLQAQQQQAAAAAGQTLQFFQEQLLLLQQQQLQQQQNIQQAQAAAAVTGAGAAPAGGLWQPSNSLMSNSAAAAAAAGAAAPAGSQQQILPQSTGLGPAAYGLFTSLNTAAAAAAVVNQAAQGSMAVGNPGQSGRKRAAAAQAGVPGQLQPKSGKAQTCNQCWNPSCKLGGKGSHFTVQSGRRCQHKCRVCDVPMENHPAKFCGRPNEGYLKAAAVFEFFEVESHVLLAVLLGMSSL